MTVCVVFALWVLVTSMGWANELFLPGPNAVWGALVKAMTKGYQGSTLLEHVGTSLYRILHGLRARLRGRDSARRGDGA